MATMLCDVALCWTRGSYDTFRRTRLHSCCKLALSAICGVRRRTHQDNRSRATTDLSENAVLIANTDEILEESWTGSIDGGKPAEGIRMHASNWQMSITNYRNKPRDVRGALQTCLLLWVSSYPFFVLCSTYTTPTFAHEAYNNVEENEDWQGSLARAGLSPRSEGHDRPRTLLLVSLSSVG